MKSCKHIVFREKMYSFNRWFKICGCLYSANNFSKTYPFKEALLRNTLSALFTPALIGVIFCRWRKKGRCYEPALKRADKKPTVFAQSNKIKETFYYRHCRLDLLESWSECFHFLLIFLQHFVSFFKFRSHDGKLNSEEIESSKLIISLSE